MKNLMLFLIFFTAKYSMAEIMDLNCRTAPTQAYGEAVEAKGQLELNDATNEFSGELNVYFVSLKKEFKALYVYGYYKEPVGYYDNYLFEMFNDASDRAFYAKIDLVRKKRVEGKMNFIYDFKKYSCDLINN